MVCQKSVRIPRVKMQHLTWGTWRDRLGTTSKIKMVSDKAELGEDSSDRVFSGIFSMKLATNQTWMKQLSP